MLEIFIGYDQRERRSWEICAASIIKHAKIPPSITPIGISTLGSCYRRKTEVRDGKLFDVISQAPMSTEFALARFFVPFVAKSNICLFVDCDFLFRSDVTELLDFADHRKAVSVVKHDYHPTDTVKMDGQVQTDYERKNWSSFMLFNLTHAKNKALTYEFANEKKGLWLHQFKWLKDEEIGEIPQEWHWIDGTEPITNPKGVHLTRGTPDMPGYENTLYAYEWWKYDYSRKS